MKKYILVFLLVALIFVPAIVWIVQKNRPMEAGLSYKGRIHRGDFRFLRDLTYKDSQGKKKVDQEIFSQIFEEIGRAQDFILLDMFLFNDDYDRGTGSYPSLSQDLCQALIEAKKARPNLDIVVISDPINTVYGAYQSPQFKAMEEAGIQVQVTDLMKVKDSNPLYSNLYRAYFQWIPSSKKGSLPNIFNKDKPKANLASYLSLLNFKANHRKVFATESQAIVASANPHDGSFYHSNIAIQVRGEIIEDIIESERAVVAMSGGDVTKMASFKPLAVSKGPASIQLLTEGKIQEGILETLKEAQGGEEVLVGLFYLADRHVVGALKEASDRGVKIRLILDQNKDAFGKKKIGIPNKQVAQELSKKENISIRWYQTQGEQYHAKFMVLKGRDQVTFIGGSANFTRRNLDDLNLETDLRVRAPKDHPEMGRILAYYEEIWTNGGGTYTRDYKDFAEDKWWKKAIYWVQETTGLSTF